MKKRPSHILPRIEDSELKITQPTTGPTVESKQPKAPYNFTHFYTLMSFLQKWRNADHEDMITLHRSQMIEIIDGVQALRAALKEIAAMDPNSIRADDLGRAARIAAAAR